MILKPAYYLVSYRFMFQNISMKVCFDNEYFHVHEILCMLAFYQLIHGTGSGCPTIKDELIRKNHAESYRTKKYGED